MRKFLPFLLIFCFVFCAAVVAQDPAPTSATPIVEEAVKAVEGTAAQKAGTVLDVLLPYLQPVIYAIIAVIAGLIYKKFGIDVRGLLDNAASKGYVYAEAWAAKQRTDGKEVTSEEKFNKACAFGEMILKTTGAGKYGGEVLAKLIAGTWAADNPDKVTAKKN